MVSALNFLSGAGMIGVAIVAIAYWYFYKRSNPVYYILGAGFWLLAIAGKVVLELAVTPALIALLKMALPGTAVIIVAALYVGLRTGVMECVLPYLGVRWTRLSKMSMDDAVAVGIGFAGIEAALFGALSMLNILAMLAVPGMTDTMTGAQKDLLAFQTSLTYIPVPVAERVFVLFCHVFATVLLVYAAKSGELRWLGLSVAVKTALDMAVPLANNFLDMATPAGTLALESYIGVIGILCLLGLGWMRRRGPWQNGARSAGGKPLKTGS